MFRRSFLALLAALPLGLLGLRKAKAATADPKCKTDADGKTLIRDYGGLVRLYRHEWGGAGRSINVIEVDVEALMKEYQKRGPVDGRKFCCAFSDSVLMRS